MSHYHTNKNGLYIPISLFIKAAGLNDPRNNQTAVMSFIRSYPIINEGYLWYHNALLIAKRMRRLDRFWMLDEDEIVLNMLRYLDEMIVDKKAEMVYR